MSGSSLARSATISIASKGGCAFGAALALALARSLGVQTPFIEALAGMAARGLRVLEINEAGTLTPHLAALPGHMLVRYPEVDMHRLPYADRSFDIVVHSDTLEHVPNPIHALAECRRVLAPGGVLCFTVPHIVGRLTRSRQGLAPSYHGAREDCRDDHLVWTEYGADSWCHVAQAGFSEISLHVLDYPSAIAMSARR
jgi:SAM-dependent methyltransferase